MTAKRGKAAKPRDQADRDNPEWTDADFAAARPAVEVHPDLVAAARRRGQRKGSAKPE
jgi:uncharacterized protein (DUF4415 family)